MTEGHKALRTEVRSADGMTEGHKALRTAVRSIDGMTSHEVLRTEVRSQ